MGFVKMGVGEKGDIRRGGSSQMTKKHSKTTAGRLNSHNRMKGGTNRMVYRCVNSTSGRYGGTARPISLVRSGRGHPRAFFSSERRLLVVVAASFRTKEWPGRTRVVGVYLSLNAAAPRRLGRLSVDMFCASSLSETRTIS